MIYYFSNFLINNIIISFFILLILLVKKLLENHITERWQYNFYFIIIVMLFIPFFQNSLFDIRNLFSSAFHHISSTNNPIGSFMNDTNNLYENTNIINDFAISTNRLSSNEFIKIFLLLWIFGISALFFVNILCIYKIICILKLCRPCKCDDIMNIFYNCKKIIGLKKEIKLLSSNSIKAPFTFGLFKIYIVIPNTIIENLSDKDIHYILLHELSHCKNKDISINYILSILQILYWFNPIIWIIFKKIKNDREIICDISVLKKIHTNNYIEYGNTIINFINETLKEQILFLTSHMGGSKKQIKRRIEKISNFSIETKKIKIKSIAIFTVVGVLTVIHSSFILAYNQSFTDTTYKFENKNVLYKDLSYYFDNMDGCFVLYNQKADKYTIYNENQSILRISPNSTYKIYSALFGLESNSIKLNNTNLDWNGTIYPFESWNKNQDLFSAMQNSVNWYFEQIDKKVGLQRLKDYFSQIKYGNYDLSSGVSNYWGESFSLKISPIEQVNLLKDFYTNKYEFNDNNIQAVKQSILISKNDKFALYGKTGTGMINDSTISGWFIGFVEYNENVYFFATNIKDKNNASGSIASKITFSILSDSIN